MKEIRRKLLESRTTTFDCAPGSERTVSVSICAACWEIIALEHSSLC